MARPNPREELETGGDRIGVDTGGTFTDLVLESAGRRHVVKLPSTPGDPARAIAAGLGQLTDLAGRPAIGPSDHVVHGTTVGLNAVLTRDLARTALVTNRGFQDLIEIARQERPDIYAPNPARPEPVVPRELRFELGQRSWPAPDGAGPSDLVEVARPSAVELDELGAAIASSGATSVAICLLHSWADPSIERRVADALAPLGLPTTCSAELLPEYREYERFSTATVNAAIAPTVGAYLERLGAALGGARLSLLQSSGGTLDAARAAAEPARVLLSGPAGGVAGAAHAAAEAGLDAIVTLDMGGTSTDVAFHPGSQVVGADDAQLAVEPPPIGGLPVGLPSLDVHTIGCGGGSLARVDAGGVLHVGPASAGADPGPVAYGKSDRLTLTDAFVALGRIQPGVFLAGGLELDIARVERAFEALGRELGVAPHDAAAAMIEIGLAAMGRAVGAMTMQRGRDPEGLALVAFGGAGGLVAVELASALGIPRVLIPADPGVLSARGLAEAHFQAETGRSLLRSLDDCEATDLERRFAAMGAELSERAADQGLAPAELELGFSADLRYVGQSYQLALPWIASADPVAELGRRFSLQHERFYGYQLPERPVELVHLRASATQRTQPVPCEKAPARELPPDATLATADVRIERSPTATPVLARSALCAGMHFEGPAVVAEYSGTTWVPPGARVEVTGGGHMLITPAGAHAPHPASFHP